MNRTDKNSEVKMHNKKIDRRSVLTAYDILLIGVILIISISGYGILALNTHVSSDAVLKVTQSEKAVLQLSGKQMEQDGIYDFKFEGGTGSIEVKGKKVRMLPMDKSICPNSICSKTGWIDGSPKIIVCMPNRLMVSFEDSNNDELDGVVY